MINRIFDNAEHLLGLESTAGSAGRQRPISARILQELAPDPRYAEAYKSRAAVGIGLDALITAVAPDDLSLPEVFEAGALTPRPSLEHRERLAADEREALLQQIAEAKSQNAKLKQKCEQLEKTVEVLRRAFRSLQHGETGEEIGRLVIHEQNNGRVSRVIDEDVAVIYETRFGPLEQVYERSQFMEQVLPREGDHIEVHCFGWTTPHVSAGIERFLTPAEQEALRDADAKRKTGPCEI